MNKKLLLLAVVFTTLKGICSDTLQISSPSGKIQVKFWINKQPAYKTLFNGKEIVDASVIDLLPEKQPALSSGISLKSSSKKEIRSQIISPVPEKRRIIPDNYNQLTLVFRKPYKIEFRVYDDGAAYRISTAFKDSLVIKNEVAEFRFPGKPSAYFPEIPVKEGADPFFTSFEHVYTFKPIDSFPETSIAYSPLLIDPGTNPKIAITESDLEEYPGMFVKGTHSSSLKAVFSHYPLEEKLFEGMPSQMRITKKGDFIAKTKGSRSFPWRIFIIAEEDKDLPSNDIVYRLASPSRVPDASWVKPGNITDEWIIDVNLFNVPFKAGRNTESYKYYIDFAHRFSFDRIMMDAGWSDENDLFKIVPEINMDTLFDYARSKGVKIALWTSAATLDRQLDSALKLFNKWGVDFIMTDFIDRDDQKAVGFHYRIAKACAEHKIMIMFHGSYPPKGFSRTYPNAVAREGVLGSEYNIWSKDASPGHDVLLAFIRMLAGPLDYEPGLLINATQKSFSSSGGRLIMSQGTRCHQLSMYIIYDSPIQFFAGNPSQGIIEPAFMELLGSLPTVWDETIILDAKVGQYIVTARRKGNDWFIGGMTDWTPRDVEINLDFLEQGSYRATICKDGINADRYAADYTIENTTVARNNSFKVHMAPGGGFLIKLEK